MRILLAGIIIMAAGISGVLYVQIDLEPATSSGILEPYGTVEVRMVLIEPDTAFYKIHLDAPFAQARVTIIAPSGETIEIISTKESVSYFNVIDSGEHTLRATLVSAGSSLVSLELGSTASAQTTYPAIVLVAGVLVIMVSLCVSISRYITEQPDENTR